MTNKLTHLDDDDLVGQLVVSPSTGEVLANVAAGGSQAVVARNSHDKSEMDGKFLRGDLLPITRVGDLQYVPIDIKGDFRSSINPLRSLAYPLLENDGTLVVLRAGYNSKYQGIFYSYSVAGTIDASDMVVTDFQYRPAFLSATEYVDLILDGNQHGFLAVIKDTSAANSYNRYLWILHNGTLNSQFHTFIDVSSITDANTTVSYIPELNVLVTATTSTTQLIYKFYNNTRTFSAVSVSEAGQPAYTLKSVDWVSFDGTQNGVGSSATVIDWPFATFVNRIKYMVSGVEQTLAEGATTPIYYHTMRPNISYSIFNGVIRFVSMLASRLTSTVANTHTAIYVSCMDYTVASNQLRPTAYANTAERQTFPLVVDPTWGSYDSNPTPPDPNAYLYKRNKPPIAWPNGSLRFTKPFWLSDDRALVSEKVSGNGQHVTLRQHNLAGMGSSKAERWHTFLSKLWLGSNQGIANIVASDASVMAKELRYVRLINSAQLLFVSMAKLAPDTVVRERVCEGDLPDTDMTEPIIVYGSDTPYFGFKPVQSPAEIADPTMHPMYTVAMAYADGANVFQNPRAVSPFCTSVDSEAIWNAAKLRYNVNFVTGSVATEYTFAAGTKAKLQAIVNNVIATSDMTSPNAVTWISTPLGFMQDGRMLLLLGLSSVNLNTSYRSFHVHVAMNVAGTVLSLPTDPLPAMLSKLQTGSSNAGQFSPYVARQGGGSYRHSDGRFFYLASLCGYAIPNSNSSPIMVVELSAAGAITRYRTVDAAQSWISCITDVHSRLGPYWTNSYIDSQSKTQARFVEKVSASYDAAHQYYCFNSLLTNNNEVVMKYLATTRSAEGFFLYVSEFPVFMRGRSMRVPTQTIDLSTWHASPANKTFLVYVEESNFSLTVKGYTVAQPETYSRVYIGKVVTGAVGVTSSFFDKVTRLDIYRPDDGQVIGSGIRAYRLLAAMNAYIYATTAEVNSAKASKVPPGFATVFNSWDRTEANNYFPGGVGATGDSAAWQLGTNPDRVIQPNNTANYCSFISPNAYTDFEFEATLHSTNADDDLIGVVVGFSRESNINYILTLMVNAGGMAHANGGSANTAWDFGFVLLNGGTIPTMPRKLVQATRSNSVSGPGWGGAYRRVRVVRDGDILTATCSAWGASRTGLTLLPASELVLDLSAFAETARYLGSSKYGYTTLSQAGATYYDIGFMAAGAGGIDPNYIYDVQTGQVWRYVSGAWTLQSGLTIQDRFGYVRKVTNPDTGVSFFVRQTSTVQAP